MISACRCRGGRDNDLLAQTTSNVFPALLDDVELIGVKFGTHDGRLALAKQAASVACTKSSPTVFVSQTKRPAE